LRRALKATFWTALALVLAAGGALLALDSAPGRRLVERAANAALTDTARLEGLDEGLLGDVRLRRLELRDGAGVWLEARDVALRWRPASLLRGALQVDRLEIGEAVLHRPPISEKGSGSDGGPPLRIAVDRFSVAGLRLAEAAPAGPATVALTGSARLAKSEDFEASVELRRLDAVGTASASLRLRGGVYAASVALDEPAGGLFARLLQLGEAPPVSLAVAGEGPLDAFDLHFQGAAGEARMTGRAQLRRGAQGLGFTADASGELAAFLPARFRPLAAGGLTLSASGLVGEDGRATLEALTARSGAFALVASGALDAARKLAGQVEASGPIAPLAELAAMRGAGHWRAAAELTGSLARPAARWRLTLTQPQLDAFAARSVAAEGDAALADGAVRMEASATVEDPVAPQAPLPATVTAQLAGAFDLATGALALRRIALEGGPYALEGQGSLAPNGEAAFDFKGSARSLDAMGARGQAAFDGALAGAIGALEGGLDLRLAGFSLGRAELDAALGSAPKASVRLHREGDALRIDRFAVRGAHGTLEGAGLVSAQRVEADLTLTLPALAPLGSPVPGSAVLKASIAGSPTAFSGPASLVAELDGARLTAEGRAGLDAKAFALRELRLGGTGLSGGGDLSMPRSGGAPEGRLELRVDELRPWAALFRTPVSGALQAEARLARGGLLAEARATNLAASDARIAMASLDVRLSDVLALRGSLAATAENVTVAGRPVRVLRLDAQSTGAAASFQLRGEAPEAALSAAGDVSWRDGERLTLKRLEGRAAGQQIRLVRPAVLSRRGDALALEGFDLAFGEGRMSADARLDARRVEGRLAAKAFPLAPFLGEAAGRLDGELRLSGAAAEPEASLTARLTAGRAGLPPELAKVALAVQGQWRGGRATFSAELAGAPGTTAQANLTLPLRGDFAAWRFALPPDGALQGGLDAEADVAALAPFLPLDGHRLAGSFRAALRASGTVAAPAASGEATLAGGRYDGAAFGTALRDVVLRLRGDGRRIALDRLAATDGGGGALSGAGEFLLQERRVESQLSFTRMRLANTDELQAIVSGALRLAGPLATLSLTGEATVHEAEYAIPRRLPTRIAELEVVEVNLPPGRKARSEARPKAGAPAIDPALDLLVRAPGQIFVRGRGLDSEWAGEVRIGGKLSDPAIGGALRVVRGQFGLAGKALKLTSGAVTFPDRGPGQEEPELDVVASTRAGDTTAELKLSGPVSALEIALSSQPPLPQDEILSRLLFGTGAASLGAAQGLQLAQTALELSGRGGSGGMLADIRKRFGLDFLDVESAEGGGLDAARLRAGKYVRENVYVGVRQGARAGSSSAVVEYEFLPSLSLEGSVGADSQAGVGLNWEKRY